VRKGVLEGVLGVYQGCSEGVVGITIESSLGLGGQEEGGGSVCALCLCKGPAPV